MSEAAFMAQALSLAQGQLGRTAPNPAVGCVIVAAGDIVASGATGDGGRPHAEEVALAAAGARAAGAVAYVTLEPCARRSEGAPSCAERLVTARIARVVIACRDPHPNAAGAGIARLAAAGIAVEEGLLGPAAQALNAGFFTRVLTGRPLLALDADPRGYDADFAPLAGEAPEAALDRLGAAGLTRVRLAPDHPLAEEVIAQGLVTRLVTPPRSAPPRS